MFKEEEEDWLKDDDEDEKDWPDDEDNPEY